MASPRETLDEQYLCSGSTGLLQYYLTSYLTGPDRLTLEMIDEQSEDAAEHFGTDKIFNRQGFLEILDKFGGYLPFSLWALPEGTVVSPGTPVLVVESEGDLRRFMTTTWQAIRWLLPSTR